MGVAAIKLDERFSYQDYLQWSDEERWELIDGLAYDMSPAPNRQHQEISAELGYQIQTFLKQNKSRCRMYYAPFDVRLPDTENAENDNIFTVVQPDISVICDLSKLDKRGCIGAPDLIIEIISPSTEKKDFKEKLMLYERHGVKEYWIVNPADKTVRVFNLLKNNAYSKPKIYAKGDKILSGVISGLAIDLEFF